MYVCVFVVCACRCNETLGELGVISGHGLLETQIVREFFLGNDDKFLT